MFERVLTTPLHFANEEFVIAKKQSAHISGANTLMLISVDNYSNKS